MALAHLGQCKPIADLKTDRSKEAQAVNIFFETALRSTLRDFAWPFAIKTVNLALIATKPTAYWGYSYQKPSDCVRVLNTPSGVRNQSRATRANLKVIGSTIYSDTQNAQLEYVFYNEQIETYPDDFVLAFAWRLASYIAPMVTGGDPFGRQAACLKMYVMELTNAQANGANEDQPDEEPASSFESAR